MKRTFILILLWTGTACLLQAQPEKKHIREGNRQFGEGKYAESELEYRKALDANSESYRATYNLGGALYKQEKYEEAGKQYQAVPGEELSAADRARFFHNLGNTHLQNGQLQESIEAYKEALRSRPDDMETKYNLSHALRLLREQQQQQQQQGQGDNENQQSEQDQQEQQDQEQQESDEQQQQQQEQQPSEDQKQKQDPKERDDQAPRDQISREDAERLLRALANNEKEVQEKVKKAEAKAAAVKVEKEW